MSLNKLKYSFTIFLFSLSLIRAQDYNIIPLLMKIESGKNDSVRVELETLKSKYPNDPNIMFLNAILTDDAIKSEEIFKKIVEVYPNSKYADASVYRLFNYYIIDDQNEIAEKYFLKLKNNYSESPYLRIAQSQYDVLLALNKTDKENETIIPEAKYKDKFKFTIQAGAFAKKENAQTLKTQFEKAGIFSEIKEKNVAGTIFNVVFAGQFENKEDAENFLMIINTQFKLQGRVVEIGK